MLSIQQCLPPPGAFKLLSKMGLGQGLGSPPPPLTSGYLRPVSGCTSGCCACAATAAAMAAAEADEAELTAGPRAWFCCCLGLLTLVLLLANSSRIVWGRSGSNRTPCCNGGENSVLKERGEEKRRGREWVGAILDYKVIHCRASSEFVFKSCVYLRCIQCHLVDMTLDAPKINATFEGKFRTLNQKDEVCALPDLLNEQDRERARERILVSQSSFRTTICFLKAKYIHATPQSYVHGICSQVCPVFKYNIH